MGVGTFVFVHLLHIYQSDHTAYNTCTENIDRKRWTLQQLRGPIHWLVTTPRTKDRSDIDSTWKDLVKNDHVKKQPDHLHETFICVPARYFDDTGSFVRMSDAEKSTPITETYARDVIPEPISRPVDSLTRGGKKRPPRPKYM